MNVGKILPVFTALVMGSVLALLAAILAVNVVEQRSLGAIHRLFAVNGIEWANVSVDGLQVTLSGTAPDEAARFAAISLAGRVVDASRVNDNVTVVDRLTVEPPHFSMEILRNDDGVSLIGLVPAAIDRRATVAMLRKAADGQPVSDLLDSASFPPPEGWDRAVGFAARALALLPRSKLSVSADKVSVVAISDSAAEKRKLETELARAAPDGLAVSIDISAPRPVITPFITRFVIDDSGARFDACSTDSEAGRERILAAARAAGLLGKATCTIGLGMPTPRWNEAVAMAIAKLAELGGGTVTFSDADVTLVARAGVNQTDYDRIVGGLEAALPDIFALHASIAAPVSDGKKDASAGPPEFVATIADDGGVTLQGRVTDARLRAAAEAMAAAEFGSESVHVAMRLDDSLPPTWAARVLASVEALGKLKTGSVHVLPDHLAIRGTTGNPDASAEIARLFAAQLGESANYEIKVSYEEKLDPAANLPTPQECVDNINAVLAEHKITFAPGSADIDRDSLKTIDKIAELMKDCTDVPMEVGGHTDSQGRESMNLGLSQSRAEAVVNALLARRVLTSNLTAKGYGESQPIADNKTEAGREQNRRIEFKLIEPASETTTTGEATPQATTTEPTGESAANPQGDGTPNEPN